MQPEVPTAVSGGMEQTELRANALELPGVVMQALAHIAPAVGMVAFIPMITAYSGVTSPLAYLIAFAIVLTLGLSLTQLARYLPAAGGYYTYISRTLHPRLGFLTAWMFFVVELLAPGAGFGFGGFILQNTLKAEYGLTVPWWAFLIVATTAVFVLSYLGIRATVRLTVLLGALEIAIVTVLAFFAVAAPGPGGINLIAFNPTMSVNAHGLFLAVVFSVFAFAGFESVAPLAEEARHPRRVLPRAIVLSILIAGLFYVFTAWAFVTGWGTNNVKGFIDSSENPVLVLARHRWGGLWIVAFLALVNSIFAIGLAASNAATRVLFAMGRSGALPGLLAKVHPRHRTPVNAIYLQAAVSIVFGLGIGFWLGPAPLFFAAGLATTLSLMLMYIAGNVGVVRFYWREHRADFNVLLHALFPLISSIALVVVGYESLNPLPPAPTWWGAAVSAVWLLIGIVVVIALNRLGRDEWLRTASMVFDEGSSSSALHPAAGEQASMGTKA